MSTKRRKVQITLPEELKHVIDINAKEDFMSVSSWIERAIVTFLQKNERITKKGNEKIIDLGI